jgi:hypothetical protein
LPGAGEGFELRLLVKLREQNPNSTPVSYDGAYVKVDVQDSSHRFSASGEFSMKPQAPAEATDAV